ncbi:ABC transporter ATP-binding protein [Shumkonia mesophila]|uniref:ABC transporter ATP-binding protein n=1 Tax=Shumkonia mesophila TaxID=2838854 RepID=UPI00293504E7|nr:ABC transporter ATP-binding protein [Shumkonia mesophila]
MRIGLDQVTLRVGTATHIYPTTVDLAPDSLNILLGPTLSGKTTLMRLLCGLDRPTAGRVWVDDADVTGVSVRRRDVAMVYQQFINYPSFTVYDNIASPLRRAGVAKADIDRRVRQVAEMLRIDGLLARLPAELSGGQQQRIALARALVKRARLLLLDEPLVNLDYKLREELRQELRAIFEMRQSCVVYATTEPLEALMLGGNTLVVDGGRVLQAGPTIDVYNRPASERVGAVFSDPPMNMIEGKVEGGAALLGAGLRVPLAGHLAGLADGVYRWGVRTNHLALSRRHVADIEIEGVVELGEISGSETFVHVAHNGVSWVAQEEGVQRFGINDAIRVYVNPGAFFVFDRAGALVAAPSGGAPRLLGEVAHG